MKNLKNLFMNIFKFSNNDINNFLLLLRKDVYPYEFMDDWEKFHKTLLLENEEFYSNLNMENIRLKLQLSRKNLQRFLIKK